MKSEVSPTPGRITPRVSAQVSRARTTVVPTAQIRPPASRLPLMVAAASSLTAYGSACIAWAARSSTSTGLKVPGPTCRSSVATAVPLARTCSNSSGVKCSPAVGAATLPAWAAYTVWERAPGPGSRDPGTAQSGGDHTRHVEHEHVPGRDELDDVAELRVPRGAGPTVEHQQAAGRAVRERVLGYLSRWQAVVEV